LISVIPSGSEIKITINKDGQKSLDTGGNKLNYNLYEYMPTFPRETHPSKLKMSAHVSLLGKIERPQAIIPRRQGNIMEAYIMPHNIQFSKLEFNK
jgi:hypothetical protein